MSIPGKVLIALLSAFTVSIVSGYINEQLTLGMLFAPTAVAALLAVVLSHRALPMPSGLAADGTTAHAPETGSARPQPKTDHGKSGAGNSTRGRGKASDSKQRGKSAGKTAEKSAEKPAEKAAEKAATKGTAGSTETGTVKWFNASKGFGFIVRENGEEIFVHHRSIQGDGRRSLRDGAEVSFKVVTTDKGPQAEDVRQLS